MYNGFAQRRQVFVVVGWFWTVCEKKNDKEKISFNLNINRVKFYLKKSLNQYQVNK
jgi:hypothetical protein